MRPLRLGADADAVGDAVDVVEVRDHLDRVVNRLVFPTMRAQTIDVTLRHRRRLGRQLNREVAERQHGKLEVGLPIVVGRVLCELFWGALATEVVGMRANSVVAVVRP